MMRTINYVVSTSLIFLVTPLWGQRQLTIIDEVSKAPIPYASVCFGMDGKYSNEQGEVFLPDSISLVEISHISYETQTINIGAAEKNIIELKPVIFILPPAIVLPDSYQIKKIGHFSEKRTTMQGGKNGYTIAEYFSSTEFINKMPILTDIILNINPFVINKTFTAIEGEQTFENCVIHIAKLRVDVRNTNDNGQPGESLIDGGIIYETKDKTSLKTHKTVNIPLENPLVFPEEGLFVVVEWIVTEDIGKHDSVTPGIWCTQSKDVSTSWDKWPAGTSWKQINLGKTEQNSRTFCIGLKILE